MYMENVTIVCWCPHCMPFLWTPTKSLIAWCMPLFTWRVRLIIIKSSKISLNVFCFLHKFACFHFFVNSNSWLSLEISNLLHISSFFVCGVCSKTQSNLGFPYARKLIFAILIKHNNFSFFINWFGLIISFCIHIKNA